MKKITLFCLFILSINYAFAQVTVQIQNLKKDGQEVTGTSFDFNGQSTITLTCDIKLSTSNGNSNNTFGNLFFYITSENFQSPYQVNFYAITFLPPWGDETKYTANLNQISITLNKSNFTSTGGTFYAEYKNNNNSIFKSISYTVNNTTGGSNPNNPGGVSGDWIPDFPTQYVPYGGIPIYKQEPDATYQPTPFPEGSYPEGAHYDYRWINSDLYNKHNAGRFLDENEPVYEYLGWMRLARKNSFDEWQDQDGDGWMTLNHPQYQIIVSQPFHTRATSNPNIEDYFPLIKVNNIINETQYLIPEYSSNGILLLKSTFPKEIIGNEASVDRRSPYHGDETILVNNYQWQRRIYRPNISTYVVTYSDYDWENIPNATNKNYTPPPFPKFGTIKNAMQYRRLINETNAAGIITGNASSNEVIVYPISINSSINNTICCNEDYYIGDTTNIISGSVPSPEVTIDGPRKFIYVWQRETFRNGVLTWETIKNSNTKDYMPSKLSSRRATEIHKYRRFVITDNYKYYLSEPVEIKWFYQNAPNAERTIEQNNVTKEIETQIIISPNPTSSTITISSEINLSAYEIKVVDMSGKTVLLRKPILNEINSIEINLESLPTGTYSVILENNFNKIIKKVIKE